MSLNEQQAVAEPQQQHGGAEERQLTVASQMTQVGFC